jgi:signal transduction histidine kinase/uncharacterized protein YoaH (UPF0181 family)
MSSIQLTAEQNHLVQFYNTEEFLCERVADFLGHGLASGEPIVIIASEARHDAFSRRLRERGYDLDPARNRGQLIWLDAHHTLAKFMVGTMPDWDLFKSTVGGSLEKSTAGRDHIRVRAYGEMVDILWKAGNPRAAVRLEEMWNDLGRSHSFHLLCAYVMGGFYKTHAASSIHDICGRHSAVFPPEGDGDGNGQRDGQRDGHRDGHRNGEDRGEDSLGGGNGVGQEAVQALVAEIGQRQQVEEALRQSLRELRQSEERERASSLRTARLQQATSSLATALTVRDVAETILSLSETVLGAAASVVYLVDEDSGAFHLVGSRGAPGMAERWSILPLDAPLPLAGAISRREPIWFESHAELLEAYPLLASAPTPSAQTQASAALPLVHAGRLVGGFALSFQGSRRFSDEDRQWLTSFAAQGALAADRARLYQAEKRAVQELTETIRMNDLFAGVLAHDLRNPLGAILTAAQLAILREERGNGEKIGVPLTRIVTSGRRMARMVDQLLDLSRIRLSGGMKLEPRALGLHPLIRQVMDELQDSYPEAALVLEGVGNLEGEWDGDRLLQVFSNLIGNALQHGRPGRGVRIRADGSEGDSVRVEVHNAGVVPPELVPRLFEPLSGSVPRADKSRGLGLGLFIAAQIVRAHGGRIDVESSEAAGTTFSVRLPRVAILGKQPGWLRQS